MQSDVLETSALNFDPHVSVDCVVLGYDGEQLQVLLSTQAQEDPTLAYSRVKLPGRLLRTGEDLDDAARDVIHRVTSQRGQLIRQFHAFGSANRTSDPRDVVWLESAIRQKIGRIVTIAYLTMTRINNRTQGLFGGHETRWYPVEQLPELAFDHKEIIREALRTVRTLSEQNPQVLFDMMPARFTALQLRRLYDFQS